MKIDILYEDMDILAVDKPAGLIVHEDGKTEEPALTDWIVENYPETEKVGEPILLKDGAVIERPGVVHRLDRETSGVMLVAKTSTGHAHLKRQFQERTIEKTYRAFVHGEIKENDGKIEKAIGRSSTDFRRRSAERGARGEMRPALTYYAVLERGKDASYIEANPKTGRTHQIRAHFKAINHPVVCDALYAPRKPAILGFNRLALHSYRITFRDLEGREKTVESALPQDFADALKQMEQAKFA